MLYRLIKTCCCFVLSILLITKLAAQQSTTFPIGISVDPGIEKICKKQKNLNAFTIKEYIDDVPEKSGLLSSVPWPLSSMVTINKKDTLCTFINVIAPIGFQLSFRNDSCFVETFVSSRSCKCFKSKLSDSALSYGAGTSPDTLILVLSKRQDLHKGDIIYGYIKTMGGEIYHFPTETPVNYDRQRFEYEGYFKFEFSPLQ
ncbi:hypothetical protein [Ferruginibacter sp.]